METNIALTTRAAEPLVSNSVPRAIQAFLLSRLSLEQVREFWCPVRKWFADLSEADFYRHIWDDRGVSPGGLLSDALARFERCAHERDGDVESAIADLRRYVNRGSWVRAGVLLSRVHKVLPELCTAKDPHRALLQVIAANCELEFVGVRTHFDKVRTRKGVNTVYGAVGPEPRSNKSVLYDGNLIASHLLQALPRAFGLPPFDEPVLHVADCRPLAAALWDEAVEVRAGAVRVDGRAIGEVVTFDSFLNGLGFEPPDWGLDRESVVLVREDYVCPHRRRVVLHRDCVYGAPYYVCRFRWRPAPPAPSDYLTAMVSEVAAPDSVEALDLEAQQAALVAEAERRVVVEYQADRESISIAGQILFSGAPARIMRHILRRYTRENRQEFEFRDFKYDREITRNPKQSGFEQRLKRITAKLAETEHLRITSAGRGRLRFTSTLPVSFLERD